MLTQRKMKEWIPETVKLFQTVMPSIDVPYPEIWIVTDKTMDKVRNLLLEKTQSQAKLRLGIPAMETIHGAGGDAIIVYQQAFRGALWDEGCKGRFQHFLWHELGHFYALRMEDPAENFSRFMDQKPHPDEFEALLGYSFWSEFIAETIAGRVTPEPEIDWSRFDWYPVRNELTSLLSEAFNASGTEVSWYDLAFYIAKVLSDKTVIGFLDAAKNGKVKVRKPYDYIHLTQMSFDEAKIDPSGLDGLTKELLPIVKDLYKYMELQLMEEKYWRVTYEDLVTIGTIIHAMERTMLMMSFAAKIPKS